MLRDAPPELRACGAAFVVGGCAAAGAFCSAPLGAAGTGAAAVTVVEASRMGCTGVPTYGETSSGSPFSGYGVRASFTMIVGAPVSRTRVPAGGDWLATLLAA